MRPDATTPEMRTPFLSPLHPGGPLLIVALSGLGKSTLTAAHPDQIIDADEFLYAAVASGFPDLEPRARLRAWRDLCRQQPWQKDSPALQQWATIRRAIMAPFTDTLRNTDYRLVVTSTLHTPGLVSGYYGIERGRYLEHLRCAGRLVDNAQSEAMNNRLEGYAPLIRMPPGTFLGQQPELLALLN